MLTDQSLFDLTYDTYTQTKTVIFWGFSRFIFSAWVKGGCTFKHIEKCKKLIILNFPVGYCKCCTM